MVSIITDFSQKIRGFFSESLSGQTFDLIAIAILVIISIAVFHLLKLCLKFLRKVYLKGKPTTFWNDFIRSDVPPRLLHLVPQCLIAIGCMALNRELVFVKFVQTAASLYLILIVSSLFSAAVMMFYEISKRLKMFNNTPIKGLFQAISLIGYAVGFLVVISMLMNRSPVLVLSGLGALSAVLMLIFKDTLLGFTAGIMLSVNKMVDIGDWIEIPSAGADGSVMDVSLTTVKVRNWDNTITTIPAYDLISRSFKNWRGMAETGARRIKRSLNIDMDTIHFADESELKRWLNIEILRPYLQQKISEINTYNESRPGAKICLLNSRKLTNIGTFRAYCQAYLNSLTTLRKDLTMMVRQLQPGSNGLPLEIYVFSNQTGWVIYEEIQSDIFDHFMAVLPEFGLSVFQVTSASSVERALKLTSSKLLPES